MSSRYGGYMGKVLYIDLGSREISLYPWTDRERELYLGGKTMAARIIADLVEPGVDPLSPENLLVVTTGPLTGTGAPCSSRFNISTISPLTGLLASSNCGGSFGLHLKRAGYDGLIVAGRANAPTWIEIGDDQVAFHDAGHIWGLGTAETQRRLGDVPGKMVIGPAGENRVLYASILSEDRAAGRAGTGAVMGAKNLKAVAAGGTRAVPVSNRDGAEKLFRQWRARLKGHPVTGDRLPRLGTAWMLSPMDVGGMLATRNHRSGCFPGAAAVSGETLAAKHVIRAGGCRACPIQCGRVVKIDGRQVKGPELETLVMLGPNIENDNLDLILRWNEQLNDLGMDTISTGSVIAFAMELLERGLWDAGLSFSDTAGLSGVFTDIAHRRGAGDLLAMGTRRLADRFGGGGFAIQSKGLELPAYDPRAAVGMGLGYATANRGGCHLGAGYTAAIEGLGLSMDPRTTRSKVALTILFQNIMEAVSASGICLFTTYTLLPGPLVSRQEGMAARMVNRLLAHSGGLVSAINRRVTHRLPLHVPSLPHTMALGLVTGMGFSFGRLRETGERGYNLERLVNVGRGVTSADDVLPRRLAEEPQQNEGRHSGVPLEEMRSSYYRLRGWSEDGVPGPAVLARLGLTAGGDGD